MEDVKKWYDRPINPFGNNEDPWPPAEYRPQLTGWLRKLVWWWRNPLHNFAFHWVGVHGHVASFSGEFLEPGFNLAWVYTEKGKRLPLFSFKKWGWEGYAGWRRNGGFGRALRVADAKDASEVD